MESDDGLGLTVQGTGNAVGSGQCFDFFPARVINVQPDKIAGIEVEH